MTDFKSKYSFDLGKYSKDVEATAIDVPVSYKEIKENPKLWVLNSPTSAKRHDLGIISPLFDLKTVLRHETYELRLVKIYRKSELTPESIKLIKKEI